MIIIEKYIFLNNESNINSKGWCGLYGQENDLNNLYNLYCILKCFFFVNKNLNQTLNLFYFNF